MKSSATSVPATEPNAPVPPEPGELQALYTSWGFLGLLQEMIAAAPREWLQILSIARNLLDGAPIPGVDIPDRLAGLVQRDGPPPPSPSPQKPTALFGRITLDEPEVRPIESMAELPKVVTSQMMWQFVDPELFFYRVITHDILIKDVCDGREPDPDDAQTARTHQPPPEPRRGKRQSVLVLRDTSTSMREGNKGVFAKAFALAYLIKAQEEGAAIADRSFANRVHARIRAGRPDEFAAVAHRILKEDYVGTTDLSEALNVTMREIRREELGLDPNAIAKTEILLISDCELPEQLPEILPGITVNTLHLAGGREGYMVRDYEERLAEVMRVSKLFVHVDTTALALPDEGRNHWLLQQEARELGEELATYEAVHEAPTNELRERARRLQALQPLYESLAPEDAKHHDVRVRLGGLSGGRRMDAADLLRAAWATLREGLAALPGRLPLPVHRRRMVANHHPPFVVRVRG